MHKVNSGQFFRFKNGDSVGEPDAESDEKFLNACFVDTGVYEVITDFQSPKCIILGRTGSGKSALISHIRRNQERVIEITPEELSIQFLVNSDIIRILEGIGIKLDIFYNLLWKHVLAVELIKNNYQLNTEEKAKSWFAKKIDYFKNKDLPKERALEYLRQWGDKFWADTEVRVREITEKLEQDVKGEIGFETFDKLKLGMSSGKKSELTTSYEIINKAQRVVNSIQAKALSDVIKLLAEDVFIDAQKKTFVLIDHLDENWVDDSIRFRLIRALIETIKSFKAIRTVKVVIALRTDLLYKILDETSDAGFQQEKYQSLFLNLSWNKSQIKKLLDLRIKDLVKQRYTSNPMGFEDIFPDKIKSELTIDFISNRTLMRPRDAIAFINECINRVAGTSIINVANIFQAEVDYSVKRLNALCFEWSLHYPNLRQYFEFLQRKPFEFKLSLINRDSVENYAVNHLAEGSVDPMNKASMAYMESESIGPFLLVLIKIFYIIGVIGIKVDSFSEMRWSHMELMPPTDGQIKTSTIISIHPMIWSAVGTVISKK